MSRQVKHITLTSAHGERRRRQLVRRSLCSVGTAASGYGPMTVHDLAHDFAIARIASGKRRDHTHPMIRHMAP